MPIASRMPRVHPARLTALAILKREGLTPQEICTALRISWPTYFRWQQRLEEMERQARARDEDEDD